MSGVLYYLHGYPIFLWRLPRQLFARTYPHFFSECGFVFCGILFYMTEKEEVRVRKILLGIFRENSRITPKGEVIFNADGFYNMMDGVVMYFDLKEKDMKKKMEL